MIHKIKKGMNEFLTDGDIVGSSVVGLSVGSSDGFCVGDFCEAMLTMDSMRKGYKSHLIKKYISPFTYCRPISRGHSRLISWGFSWTYRGWGISCWCKLYCMNE